MAVPLLVTLMLVLSLASRFLHQKNYSNLVLKPRDIIWRYVGTKLSLTNYILLSFFLSGNLAWNIAAETSTMMVPLSNICKSHLAREHKIIQYLLIFLACSSCCVATPWATEVGRKSNGVHTTLCRHFSCNKEDRCSGTAVESWWILFASMGYRFHCPLVVVTLFYHNRISDWIQSIRM